MTYFGFLLRFVVLPIIVLLGIHLILHRQGRRLPDSLRGMPAALTLFIMILVALVYTTPWDNYLVATGVWYYDPELVTGIVIGYVPIEEYTFFVLQPILTGLWLYLLAMTMQFAPDSGYARPRLRLWSAAITAFVWLAALLVFLFGPQPATYLTITLAWALPPIILQLAFGADILWHFRKLVFWSLVPATLYLSAADSLAIRAGTWTIAPDQSLGIYLGGVLPIEEFVFFLLTNTLLVLGVTLVIARASHVRLHEELIPWMSRRLRRGPSQA